MTKVVKKIFLTRRRGEHREKHFIGKKTKDKSTTEKALRLKTKRIHRRLAYRQAGALRAQRRNIATDFHRQQLKSKAKEKRRETDSPHLTN